VGEQLCNIVDGGRWGGGYHLFSVLRAFTDIMCTARLFNLNGLSEVLYIYCCQVVIFCFC
jgi:hypothetical protein